MIGLDFKNTIYYDPKKRREELFLKRKKVLFKAMFVLFMTGFLWLFYGCGGGLGVMNTLDSPISDQLSSAWNDIRTGQLDRALSTLTDLLDAARTDEEKKEISTALGWAWAQKGDINKAISYFEIAADSSFDAKFGLASCLIARGDKGDYSRAYEVLSSTPLSSLDSSVKSEHNLSYSAAEAHALYAIAAFSLGKITEAKNHIKRAKELDLGYGYSPVSRIYDALITKLGI